MLGVVRVVPGRRIGCFRFLVRDRVRRGGVGRGGIGAFCVRVCPFDRRRLIEGGLLGEIYRVLDCLRRFAFGAFALALAFCLGSGAVDGCIFALLGIGNPGRGFTIRHVRRAHLIAIRGCRIGFGIHVFAGGVLVPRVIGGRIRRSDLGASGGCGVGFTVRRFFTGVAVRIRGKVRDASVDLGRDRTVLGDVVGQHLF